MEYGAWRFRAKRIRNDIAAGKFDSFLEYVYERLQTETSFQFMADGMEYLPDYTGPNDLDPLVEVVMGEKFYMAVLYIVDQNTGNPFNLLIIGKDADSLKDHMQKEYGRMLKDGIVVDGVSAFSTDAAND